MLTNPHPSDKFFSMVGHRCESTIQRYRHIKAESLRALIEREKVVELKKKVK